MKHVNILSITQAYTSLEENRFKNLLRHHGIDIKNEELDDLIPLIKLLHSQGNIDSLFSNFFVGFKIPQIGKEFDLLRFGKQYTVNIEIKKSATKEKIAKQLERNKYYLDFIGKPVFNFTFISSTKELFSLQEKSIELASIPHLTELLKKQEISNISNIDDLFDPSDYLVSPFNSTKKFINNEYFLTHQQEEISKEVIDTLLSTTTATYAAIRGSAGTGKTLLTYDIAKKLKATQKNPLIIHCGNLNEGHLELKNSHNWEITSIRDYKNYKLSDYYTIIIDEAQRIYKKQLEEIIKEINTTNGRCVFSYDKLQTLADWEEDRKIDELISSISSLRAYTLTEKIRTNKEIASFIKAIFNKNHTTKIEKTNNIEINFFNNPNDAKNYLLSLNHNEWEVLRFTPSQYNTEHHEKYSYIEGKTAHKVIGQEFDSVVVTIDNYFSYDEHGDLIYTNNTYYNPTKMLFQNISRTRKRLNVVIINNDILLDRCLSILDN